MTGKISLTASMRSNLLSLQNISRQVSSTQNKLATGNKVNSAIDNPSSYYTARSLTNRANDLDILLDSMGQAVSTIKTASTAISTAADLIEQMSSIAQSASEVMGGEVHKIDSTMSTLEIQQILNQGGIVSLQDDITLTDTLNINIAGTTIVGNGHSITYAGAKGFQVVGSENVAGDAAINIIADAKISGLTINYSNSAAQGTAISIAGAKADIDNITINGTTTANRLYGIQVLNGGKLSLDTTKNINLGGDYSQKLVNGNPDLWAGKYNTDMIVNQIGDDGAAASACKNYSPDASLANNADFGKGQWYLPSIGELADLYGTDYSQITQPSEGHGMAGAIGDNKAKVNAALKTLQDKGVDAKTLTESWNWSSSEEFGGVSWFLGIGTGERSTSGQQASANVRPFQLLENCFNPATNSTPQIGDVMYADKTWGSAEDYDGSKQAVGIITNINEDSSSATIVALKDIGTCKWQSSAYKDEQGRWHGTNITAIKDYRWGHMYTGLAKGRGDIAVSNREVEALDVSTSSYAKQYTTALNAYDQLISDSSYQGINLIKGDSLKVTFNENGNHAYEIKGTDISSTALGLGAAQWETLSDIKASIVQLKSAVSTLRKVDSELGNNYSIIQTRQDFTESLINILTEGADKLTLADMNEESANMLALQTRQQLAINSLSLASQAAQAVMKLF